MNAIIFLRFGDFRSKVPESTITLKIRTKEVSSMNRPATTEYAPYYQTYIKKVPDGDIIQILAQQMEKTQELIRGLPPGKANFRYAPGKWNIKEVFGHLVDTERVFAYRALCSAAMISRPSPLLNRMIMWQMLILCKGA